MKTWYQNLSISRKVLFVSAIAVVVTYLSLIFGYFVNLSQLPNGLIVGGLVSLFAHLALTLTEKKDEENNKPTLTIVITIVRFIVIGVLIFLAIYLEYELNVKAINVFTLIGGYLIPFIAYLIIYLAERKNV